MWRRPVNYWVTGAASQWREAGRNNEFNLKIWCSCQWWLSFYFLFRLRISWCWVFSVFSSCSEMSAQLWREFKARLDQGRWEFQVRVRCSCSREWSGGVGRAGDLPTNDFFALPQQQRDLALFLSQIMHFGKVVRWEFPSKRLSICWVECQWLISSTTYCLVAAYLCKNVI